MTLWERELTLGVGVDIVGVGVDIVGVGVDIVGGRVDTVGVASYQGLPRLPAFHTASDKSLGRPGYEATVGVGVDIVGVGVDIVRGGVDTGRGS